MYAVHPGIVNAGALYNSSNFNVIQRVAHLLKTSDEGGVTVSYCAISPKMEIRGGAYICNCKEGWSSGYSKSKENQERLFKISKDLLNIEEFGKIET
jgi:hypothetical protein